MVPRPMHLRLEATEGSGEEYRIYDGQVEVRSLQTSSDDDGLWYRVTPEELTEHVNQKTIVAEWLNQRLGWRGLLRACLPEQDLQLFGEAETYSERRAA